MGFFKKIRDFFKRTNRNAADDPIKHVVVLMFENRSFDQMLGCFKSVYPSMEGIDPDSPRSNRDSSGKPYFQLPSTDPTVEPDPKHELEHVINQLKNGNGEFVSEYERAYPHTSQEDRQRIMDYFAMDDLPSLHALAKKFTICDHWYSSVPGPTWTNRFFIHTGTSKGLVSMPESIRDTHLYLSYDQDTIFDRLNERNISWRVYFGDCPNSLVLQHQHRNPKNLLGYRLMSTFFSDAEGPEENFPAYAFIEPHYLRGEQNDDHPPHSAMRAQRLLARVYGALRANLPLWNSTLLVVVYDEHGGFYDHVEPPAAVPPDSQPGEYTFDRLGVRVPALLVSPWVDQTVVSTEFDHTSLLRYLIDKWQLRELTDRVRKANSLADAIRRSGTPRTDTPPSLPIPVAVAATRAGVEVVPEDLSIPPNENQVALEAFSEHLAQETGGPVATAATKAAAGPAATDSEVARLRVQTFLVTRSGNPG